MHAHSPCAFIHILPRFIAPFLLARICERNSEIETPQCILCSYPSGISSKSGSTPGLDGVVTITENLGTEFLVTVDVAGELFRATIEEGHEPDPGATVRLLAAPHRVLLYDAETHARI